MAEHAVDGPLRTWDEIAEEGWDTLLVGNGLSINVSPDFAYDSLYEQAEENILEGGLDDRDREIFELFETTNFEVVLGKLRDSIALGEIIGRREKVYRQRFRSIQGALGGAIRRVHLKRTEVPDEALEAIKEELASYRAIFSTSYDLILYWAIGYGEDYEDFCDCFWGTRYRFDPSDARVRSWRTPVYYCHGALHLIVEGSGTTRKLKRGDRNLLDQFGEPIKGDLEARPLLITEGSARDKLQAIEANDYLAHVYEALKNREEPLVVFGHTLGEQDRHLVDAINANPKRAVAVSMVDQGRRKLRRRRGEILSRLEGERVYFFDAATHPLGSPDLAAVAEAE